MRQLGFDVTFRPTPAPDALVAVHVGAAFTAQEMIDDGIIDASIGYFVEAVAASKGVASQFQMRAVAPREIHISAARTALDQPWHMAAIVNMLDSATFLGQGDDEPFIDKVEVGAPHTLIEMYENLAAYMESCRAAIDQAVPEPIDMGDAATDAPKWPAPALDYIYDMVINLSAPLHADAQTALTDFLARMDQVMAESAFEAETTPDEWLEDGVVPYPVEFEVSEEKITYSIEMPPTDVAPILLMMMDIMRLQYRVQVASIDVDIREGW